MNHDAERFVEVLAISELSVVIEVELDFIMLVEFAIDSCCRFGVSTPAALFAPIEIISSVVGSVHIRDMPVTVQKKPVVLLRCAVLVFFVRIPDSLMIVGSDERDRAVCGFCRGVIETDDGIVIENDNDEFIVNVILTRFVACYVFDSVQRERRSVISVIALFCAERFENVASVIFIRHAQFYSVIDAVNRNSFAVRESPFGYYDRIGDNRAVFDEIMVLIVDGNEFVHVVINHIRDEFAVRTRREDSFYFGAASYSSVDRSVEEITRFVVSDRRIVAFESNSEQITENVIFAGRSAVFARIFDFTVREKFDDVV